MGSLSSRPAVPAPVIVQQVPAISPAPSAPNTGGGSNGEGNDQTVSEVRAQNLLQRNRGRLGTILTGFRGLLSLSSPNSQKRTLLGE